MNEKKHLVVEDQIVVTMEFLLKVDNQIFEDSSTSEPIQFLQGSGQLLPALEGQLYGMAVGDRKQLIISAQDGYGQIDPEAIFDIPRSDFPKEIPLRTGIELQLQDDEGETRYGRIEAVDANHVRVNTNHILAGKELHFDIRITALRTATAEEIEHGHVHLGHEH